jgi:phosphoribosylglycinamide formyltransferase-1
VTGGLKVAVLASGVGSNLQALLDTVHGVDGIEIVAVASDKPAAAALERARAAGVEARAFPAAEFPNGGRSERDAVMAEWLLSRGVGLVVSAGYMQLLGAEFLSAFPDRVINVHPALLPAFPGLDAVGQALDYGVKVFGVTVHFVDSGVDSGAVIAQRAVELPQAREREEVLTVLHRIEHELLPEAVRRFARGEIRVASGHARRVLVGP